MPENETIQDLKVEKYDFVTKGEPVYRAPKGLSEEVVRQIPAEELLAIARFIEEQRNSAQGDSAVKGLLMDQQG